VWSRNPSTLVDTLLIAQPQFNWDTQRYKVCAADDNARQLLLVNFVDYLAQRGTTLCELDQMNGGRTEPCYNPNHDHPRGYGRWMAESVAQLMFECQTAGRLHDAEFGLSLEDPGEFFIPYLSAYGTRVNRVHGWPAGVYFSLKCELASIPSGHATVVPAFAFVYSDLLSGHVLDSYASHHTTQSYTPPDYRPAHATGIARTFVAGSWLGTGIAPWAMLAAADAATGGAFTCGATPANPALLLPEPNDADATHLSMLRKAAGFTQGLAAPYFTEGKLVRTSGAVIGTFSFTHHYEGAYSHPIVEIQAWEMPNGDRALMIGNCQGLQKSTIASLPTHWDGQPISGGTVVNVYKDPALAPVSTTYGAIQNNLLVDQDGIVVIELL
jgi:hypothetical protein